MKINKYLILASVLVIVSCSNKKYDEMICNNVDTLYGGDLFFCVPDSFRRMSEAEYRNEFNDDSRNITMISFVKNDSTSIIINEYQTLDIKALMEFFKKDLLGLGYKVEILTPNKISAYRPNGYLNNVCMMNVFSSKKSSYSISYSAISNKTVEEFSLINNYKLKD